MPEIRRLYVSVYFWLKSIFWKGWKNSKIRVTWTFTSMLKRLVWISTMLVSCEIYPYEICVKPDSIFQPFFKLYKLYQFNFQYHSNYWVILYVSVSIQNLVLVLSVTGFRVLHSYWHPSYARKFATISIYRILKFCHHVETKKYKASFLLQGHSKVNFTLDGWALITSYISWQVVYNMCW